MVYLHSNSQFIVKNFFAECHLTRHSANIWKNYFLKGFDECQIGGTRQSRCSTRRSGGFRTYSGAFHNHARTPHTRHTHTHACSRCRRPAAGPRPRPAADPRRPRSAPPPPTRAAPSPSQPRRPGFALAPSSRPAPGWAATRRRLGQRRLAPLRPRRPRPAAPPDRAPGPQRRRPPEVFF